MTTQKAFLIAAMLVAMPMAGCQREEDTPMEKAADAVEDAGEAAQDAVDDAGDDAEDAAEDAADALRDGGD